MGGDKEKLTFLDKYGKKTILGLLFFNFLLLSYYSHSANLYTDKTDQSAYLNTAFWVKTNGGISNFLNSCLSGAYPETNRQPLYILLISPFASRNIRFFTSSKLISTLIAFFVFLIFFYFVKTKYGFWEAVFFVGLLITTEIFVKYLAMVSAEYLLVFFVFFTWYFATKGFEDNKLWIWAGAFNGAAYMSKGSGILLLSTFLLTYFTVNRKDKKKFSNKYLYSYLLAFILVTSPLLIRNTVVYGSPLYNVNQKYLWLENWSQRNDPGIFEKASMLHYLKTHSLKTISRRFVEGMKIQVYFFRDSFNSAVINFGNYYHELWYELALIIISIIYVISDQGSHRKLYLLILFLTHYALLSFGAQITMKGSRMFMPITVILMLYASIGITDIIHKPAKFLKIKKAENTAKMLAIILISIVSLSSISLIVKRGVFKNPMEMYVHN